MITDQKDQEPSLFSRLEEHDRLGIYPFHMPGHKRNTEILRRIDPRRLDITEIAGFDDLHHPRGILKDIENRAASLFGADETFLQVNGSTGGILAALSAVPEQGSRIIVARNCHKAVYHAIEIRGLKPVYICPKISDAYGLCGSVLPEEVERAIRLCETDGEPAQAVVITSPTYEGVVSDIAEIAKIAHRYNIPLIVDEAHGAHFSFHEYFPESALRQGADLVIQSLHKTLPAYTQTALLHVLGNRIDRKKLQHFCDIYETSSPSYLLMGSMEECFRILKEEGKTRFDAYTKRLQKLRSQLEKLEFLKLVGDDSAFFDMDRGKITLSLRKTNQDGNMLSERLRREYRLEMELSAPEHILAMTSLADTQEGFDRFYEAVSNLDMECGKLIKQEKKRNGFEKNIRDNGNETVISSWGAGFLPDKRMEPGEAVRRTLEEVPLFQAAGKISGGYIGVYPPGIPFLVPGEVVTEETMSFVLQWCGRGILPSGIEQREDGNWYMPVICK